MADLEHSDITDPYIHEPKGASTASASTVWVADGAGSGAFDLLTSASLDETSIHAFIQAALDGGDVTVPERMFLTAVIPDISTAQSIYVPVPVSATLDVAYGVLGGAIATADAVISFYDAVGNSMGTGVTVPEAGSAAGQGTTFTPTANNVLTGPTNVRVATDGASDNAVPLYLTLVFTVNP